MAWQFVYRASKDTFLFGETVNEILLPILFQPFYRIAIYAQPLAGLSINEKSVGNIFQRLFIDGLGFVKGDSMPLAPGYQLITPSTEFPFRLVFQPVSKLFRLEISIWVETEPFTLGGADGGTDTSLIAVQIATLSAGQGALLEQVTALQETLISIGSEQEAITAQVAALASAQAQSVITLDLILQKLNEHTTPTPTPAPAPTATRINYTATTLDGQSVSGGSSLSNLYDGNPAGTDHASQIGSADFVGNHASCSIKLSFATSSVIKKLRFSPGLPNGAFHMPSSIKLYVGVGVDQQIFTVDNPFTSSDHGTFKEFDLSSNATSSTVYRLDLTSTTGVIAVREMQVIGYGS